MSYGYDTQLRKRVMGYYKKSGRTQAEVAAIFGISPRSIGRWIRLERETGYYDLKDRPEERKARKIPAEELKAYIQKHPDHFLWEIAEHFQAKISSVFMACQKLKIVRKKNHALQRKRRTTKTRVSAGNSQAKS